MVYLHHESLDCAVSELDLFHVPPTNTQIESGIFVSYQPVASITDSGPIEFFISASGEEYIDLSQTLFHVQGRIVKGNGAAVVDANKVGPVNLLLHSLFSQIDIYFNDKLINTASNTYPYRAYIETLLNYGSEAKQSQFTEALWYKDTPGRMNATDASNTGLSKRTEIAKKSIDLIGRPHIDLFHQDRYLVNNVNIKIRFTRSRPQFYFMCGENSPDYKVLIEDATLYVRKAKLTPSVVLAHMAVLERGITMKLPFNRVEMKTFTINSGLSSIVRENITLGQLPERIVVGFVDAEAFNGDYKKNPFEFGHQYLTYLAVYADSKQVPFRPLELDFEKGRYIRGYHTLFGSLGKIGRDKGNHIDREDFSEGYALYAFDLTPGLTAGSSNLEIIRQGNVRVEARFAKPLPHAVCCILYMEFESIMEIDSERNIHFDYST